MLLEQEIDSIPYGGCSVIRVDLDPLEEDTAFLAFLLSSDSDAVDCSGNYLAVTRPVQDTIEVLSVSWLDGEGEPLQQLTAGPVQVRYTVKNTGDGREYTVILAAYTSAGQMITSGTSTVFIGASECCDITAALDLSTFGGDFFVKAFLLDESSCPVGSPSQPD